MIKLDPRPPRGGRPNTEAKNCFSVSIRAPLQGRLGVCITITSRKKHFREANLIFIEKLLALAKSAGYKKASIRKNRMLAPIDGLKNKAHPSVRGRRSNVFGTSRQWTIREKWNVDMTRKHNTTRTGGSFSDATIQAVWLKATPISGRSGYAKDQCGATIYRHSYGAITDLGWEVDHRNPVSNGGQDDLDNLQPLQWHNNRGKGDQYPRWSCTVRS